MRNMRGPHGMVAGSDASVPPRALMPFAISSMLCDVVICSEKPSPFVRSRPFAPSS